MCQEVRDTLITRNGEFKAEKDMSTNLLFLYSFTAPNSNLSSQFLINLFCLKGIKIAIFGHSEYQTFISPCVYNIEMFFLLSIYFVLI